MNKKVLTIKEMNKQEINEQDQIGKKIKELLAEIKKTQTLIKQLRKQKKAVSNTEKISWSKIAFQMRIYQVIWSWASPHSNYGTTLQDVENFIKEIPNNKKKVAESLQELQKLKYLSEDAAISKARSYINNKRNDMHRNGNRWS